MLKAIGILALGCAAAFGQATTWQMPYSEALTESFTCGSPGPCSGTANPLSGMSSTITWNGAPPVVTETGLSEFWNHAESAGAK